ncbi:hypothetical protein T11_14947 [Trichinella zimbabwensis]|uniref:Uncharacterized protein n=1 Tax=Trichinella zimbabwensis TaxID=268475 RepID=A0A0V1H7K0_9BILA|nr:hypothetical protein T11_14947 [Trichinella zimbabwensis]
MNHVAVALGYGSTFGYRSFCFNWVIFEFSKRCYWLNLSVYLQSFKCVPIDALSDVEEVRFDFQMRLRDSISNAPTQ